MRPSLLVTLLVMLSGPVSADPRLQCWIRGDSSNSAIVPLEVQSVQKTDDGFVRVESMGASLRSLGVLEARPVGNGDAARRRLVYSIPISPTPAAQSFPTPPGITGAFLTGVPVSNPGAFGSYQDQNLWHTDGMAALDNGTLTTTGRDAPGKNPPATSTALKHLLHDNDRHSPLIGFALDGYPIYGPFGWDEQRNIRRFHSGYRLRNMSRRTELSKGLVLTPAQEGPAVDERFPAGTFIEDYEYVEGSGDLDEHNGRFAFTPEFPEGTYAYYLATADDGRMQYPYLVGPTYKGEYSAADVSRLTRFGEDSQLTLLGVELNIRAGERTSFAFLSASPVLERVHEQLMHLMVVSEDLESFDHIHPQPIAGNLFRVTYKFPHGGVFWLLADHTAPGDASRVARFRLTVDGPPRSAAPKENELESTIVRSGVRAELSTDQPLRTGRDITFRFALTEQVSGRAINDLQPYLGAWAHVIAISEDAAEVIHAHALEKVTNPQTGEHTHAAAGPSPSEIVAATGFRCPGVYKLWLQVQRDSEIITFPFVLQVQRGAEQQPDARVDKVRGAGNSARSRLSVGSTPLKSGPAVTVSSRGFEPSRIEVPAGKPIRLAFTRVDAQNCIRQVVIPELGIKRDLPPGRTVVVDLPPQPARELHLACGMGMYKGSLVVRQTR